MGDKTQREMVELLKTICVYEKTTLQEVQIMRKEINANMKAQHEILKQWMMKDLDHHFKDNKVAMAVIEKMNAPAQESKFPYPCNISQEIIEEGRSRQKESVTD